MTTLSLVENAFVGRAVVCELQDEGRARGRGEQDARCNCCTRAPRGSSGPTGRYAAATVRGTKWTIADRCDGTLTHDLTDSVVVTDFVRHKTIVLHAGQSYLAKSTPPKKKKK